MYKCSVTLVICFTLVIIEYLIKIKSPVVSSITSQDHRRVHLAPKWNTLFNYGEPLYAAIQRIPPFSPSKSRIEKLMLKTEGFIKSGNKRCFFVHKCTKFARNIVVILWRTIRNSQSNFADFVISRRKKNIKLTSIL